MNSQLEKLTEQLWSNYTQLNPEAQKIHNLFTDLGEPIQNDHIAMRTFNRGPFRNEMMISFFEKYDYKVCGNYFFEQKKLDAVHLENKDPSQPKIFLSELKVECFSENLQSTVDQLISEVSDLSFEEIFGQPRPWKAEHTKYQELKEESEYAGWLYAHGVQVNHFTVFTNPLKTFNNLESLNTWLIDKGFVMNTSGGIIKGTPQQMLEQSSTMAPSVEVVFSDGSHKIPGCYYEFAQRYPDSQGRIFQGFITGSADKIFESTNERKPL